MQLVAYFCAVRTPPCSSRRAPTNTKAAPATIHRMFLKERSSLSCFSLAAMLAHRLSQVTEGIRPIYRYNLMFPAAFEVGRPLKVFVPRRGYSRRWKPGQDKIVTLEARLRTKPKRLLRLSDLKAARSSAETEFMIGPPQTGGSPSNRRSLNSTSLRSMETIKGSGMDPSVPLQSKL